MGRSSRAARELQSITSTHESHTASTSETEPRALLYTRSREQSVVPLE